MKSIYYIAGAVVIVTGYLIYEKRSNILQSIDDVVLTPTTNITTSDGSINNILNIRTNNDAWIGEITSPSQNFMSFASVAYCVRAGIIILRNYYKEGYATLQDMISRWAPTGDGANDPTTYANYVSSQTGISTEQDMGSILYTSQIADVIKAMSQIESGTSLIANNVPDATFTTGYNLA